MPSQEIDREAIIADSRLPRHANSAAFGLAVLLLGLYLGLAPAHVAAAAQAVTVLLGGAMLATSISCMLADKHTARFLSWYGWACRTTLVASAVAGVTFVTCRVRLSEAPEEVELTGGWLLAASALLAVLALLNRRVARCAREEAAKEASRPPAIKYGSLGGIYGDGSEGEGDEHAGLDEADETEPLNDSLFSASTGEGGLEPEKLASDFGELDEHAIRTKYANLYNKYRIPLS